MSSIDRKNLEKLAKEFLKGHDELKYNPRGSSLDHVSENIPAGLNTTYLHLADHYERHHNPNPDVNLDVGDLDYYILHIREGLVTKDGEQYPSEDAAKKLLRDFDDFANDKLANISPDPQNINSGDADKSGARGKPKGIE